MRFIAVGRRAAEELVSGRQLQSTEFALGRHLGEFLVGKVKNPTLGTRIAFLENDVGAYFLAKNEPCKDLLVLDLEQAPMFATASPDDALVIFQKLMRFAVRHWKKLKYSACEKLIQGTTKAAVFPFPISEHTKFRITIEREPDQRRREKRDDADVLLAYKCGTSAGPGAKDENPILTVFRKAMEGYPAARSSVLQAPKTEEMDEEITAIKVTSLEQPEKPIRGHLGYEGWRRQMTEAQLAFVDAPLKAPHRLEGPAGTGKTLCLVQKCIGLLKSKRAAGEDHHALFVTHSEATRQAIRQLFEISDEDGFSAAQARHEGPQTVEVHTLQSLCGALLETKVSELEFLDRDAMTSKEIQLLYITEALEECLETEFATHAPFLSDGFKRYLEQEDHWAMAQVLQHEIAVVIKGRADEDLKRYQSIKRLRYGLPTETDDDRAFVHVVFRSYQEKLAAAGQFDTDDIVISALRQLDTPIWRRRRRREGYDSLFVDETHLFNVNELSVFHHLTANDSQFAIAYSIDCSQAVGDRGWEEGELGHTLEGGFADGEETAMRSVFRCSPEIVNLAFSITSAGATLFTNFQDPLKLAASTFTEEEERRCVSPRYLEAPNERELLRTALDEAQEISTAFELPKSEIAVVVFADELMQEMLRVVEGENKPVEVLRERGDVSAVKKAKEMGRFVLSAPDYVGGLEFAVVILVGVDDGRVPPTQLRHSSETAAFLSYNAHNRLYVAVSRARFQVVILGEQGRGPSKLLSPAFEAEILRHDEPTRRRS